jgi:hypothetical protein
MEESKKQGAKDNLSKTKERMKRQNINKSLHSLFFHDIRSNRGQGNKLIN